MLTLQPFTSADFPELISWIDSPNSLMQFAGPAFNFPLTPDQLENLIVDTTIHPFNVVDTITNNTIGHAEIHKTSNSIYLARILIGDRQNRNKGIGKQIIKLLLEHASANFPTSSIQLNVFDWNIQAIKCYENAGFKINPEKSSKRIVNGQEWIAINMYYQQ